MRSSEASATGVTTPRERHLFWGRFYGTGNQGSETCGSIFAQHADEREIRYGTRRAHRGKCRGRDKCKRVSTGGGLRQIGPWSSLTALNKAGMIVVFLEKSTGAPSSSLSGGHDKQALCRSTLV